ncbi:ATP-binding cassette domain-containing protein, partial [Streptococcus oralis]|uniref:ATP-binding cassette domain-containing protein n=1 Tax=Streptococcus oralis TaxID=1303 RepID=UPI00240D56CA
MCLHFKRRETMKIAIIGYSGAGKSTLAKNLSKHYQLACLHMDQLQFQPGWQDSDRDWMLTEMKNFLTKHETWIIDGNYSWCYYKERMLEADQIIFLNFSPWTCLFRAFKRYLTYRGKVRESMAAGCPERFD